MRAHGMVYFLFNAHQNDNYCIPEGHGSATLFHQTLTLSRACMKGAGHEISVLGKRPWTLYHKSQIFGSHYNSAATDAKYANPVSIILVLPLVRLQNV